MYCRHHLNGSQNTKILHCIANNVKKSKAFEDFVLMLFSNIKSRPIIKKSSFSISSQLSKILSFKYKWFRPFSSTVLESLKFLIITTSAHANDAHFKLRH